MIVGVIGAYTGFVTVFREAALFLRSRPVSVMNAGQVEPARPRDVVMFGDDTRSQENIVRPSDSFWRAAPEWNGASVVSSPQRPPHRPSQN